MAVGRNALGRGLGALIPGAASQVALAHQEGGNRYLVCPIGQIEPDPDQPRQHIHDEALAELISSVREKGVLQPLVARQQAAGRFRLIAGERRYRAAMAAGLTEVPVVVKDVSPDEAFELALIENIQREDLDPIEEAVAYQRLQHSRGYSQESLAAAVGKNRTTVANALRLLKLQPDLQALVINGHISAGHARCLLSLEDLESRRHLAQRIRDEDLSVRQTEAAVKAIKAHTGGKPVRRNKPSALAPRCEVVARDVGVALGAKVAVSSRGRKGRIQIHFESPEDLERLARLLTAG